LPQGKLIVNQLDESFQKIECSFLKLILGIGGGIILLITISVAGYHFYAGWEEGHLLRRAAGFISGGNDKDAALTVRRALQLEPESVQGARLMAEIAERAGDRAALDWRRKVLDQQPHSSSDLIAWANTAMQFDDLTIAKTALDRVDEKGKASAPFHASAARLATAEKRPRDAEAHWETAAKLAPADKSYQLQLGLCRLESNDAGKRAAGETILQSLRNDPGQRAPATRALIAAGMARNADAEQTRALARELTTYPEGQFSDRLLHLDVLRRYQDAEFASALTDVESDAAKNPARLASLIGWMNGNRNSLLAIDFVRDLSPEILAKWPVPLALADSYSALADWRSLEELTRQDTWGQFDFLRHVYLSRALRGQDKLFGAKKEWATAEKEAAIQSQSLLLLSRVTSEWGWTDETSALLWSLTKFADKQLEALHTLYRHYKEKSDTQGLYRVLLRLAEINPDDMGVQNNLAQIGLLLDADTERAQKLAAEVYRKDPANAAYVSTYAFALYRKGRTRRGLALMGALKERDLEEPSTSAYYGILLAAAEEEEKAGPYLARAAQGYLLPEEKALVEKAQRELAAR
jgi:predicted Zn-dependent protease